MSPHTPHPEEPTHAPAWSPETETREDVKALLLRRTTLLPSEVLTFRKVYPDIYDTYLETLRCVVRSRGARGAVELELVHDALESFWRTSRATGMPESIQAKLISLAGGLAWNHMRYERRRPTTQHPTSSKETPGSFPRPERAMDLHETASGLFHRLSPKHKAVVTEVFMNDKTVAEAARALKISRTTVASRLTAALALLIEWAEDLTTSEREL